MSVFDTMFYRNPLAGVGNPGPSGDIDMAMDEQNRRRAAERAAADQEQSFAAARSRTNQQQMASTGSGQYVTGGPAPGASPNPHRESTQTPTPPPAAPPGRGPIDPGAAGLARAGQLYPTSNPMRALTNALADIGISTRGSNPVIRTLLSMAPGLAAAFTLRGASGQFGNQPESVINAGGGVPGYFGDFLRSALTGRGNSGALGTLMQPFGGLSSRDALRKVAEMRREYNVASAKGGDGFTINPFMEDLNELLQNSSDGGAGFISSLYTPFMDPRMARGYGAAMDQRSMLAPRFVDYTNPDYSDPFTYLLGMPQY